jgi:hypothetical protein
MSVKTINALCSLCGEQYAAPANVRAYHGLCPTHWSGDTLREWDRWEAARSQAAHDVPATLTLAEWLAILSHHRGKCAICQQVQFSRLATWIPAEGLTAHNVVPLCKACHWNREHSWRDAIERVTAQLRIGNEDTTAI